MYVGQDFPDTTPSETQRPLAFDFVDALGTGELINSSVWTITVAANSDNTDPIPSAHLVGGSVIAGSIVSQNIGGCLDGVLYLITCIATTSLGNTPEFSSYILCAAPV